MSSPEQWTHPEPGVGPAATAAKPTAEQVIAGLRATSEGGPELVQLLTPEGERVENPEWDPYVADVTAEDLRNLYRDMVLTRRVDRECNALQRQGQLGIWVPLLGQEAAQVGSGRAMRPQDMAFPSYREHGVAWCRGVPPTDLLGIFRGTDHGSWDPIEKRFHLYTIVIGNQVLNAAGYAMGQRFEGRVGDDDGEATIVYFGDGATSQGDVHEGFVWASVYDAPLVFFCQNNQWAISEPTEKQTRVPLYQRAAGFGFPGVRVDGNDVLAVLAVTRAALDHARTGNGPTLVEAFTYRMGAHTTSDDPTKYRMDEERAAWEAKDPIARLRTYLTKNGWADDAFLADLETESDALAKRVREGVRSMPNPDTMAIFDNVYADGHALVDEERAQFAKYQASFEDASEGMVR